MDASWLEGPSGYGYSNNAAEAAHLSTRLDDMRNTYLSVYARIPFQIQPQELESLEALILTMFPHPFFGTPFSLLPVLVVGFCAKLRPSVSTPSRLNAITQFSQ